VAAQSAPSARVNRWVILAGYALLTACTQWLWLAYAPITTQTHQIMGVSQGAVGDLAGIFPFVYVILALPAGRWLDLRFARRCPSMSTGSPSATRSSGWTRAARRTCGASPAAP